jgi:uncharacterized protein (TIGR03435 family)
MKIVMAITAVSVLASLAWTQPPPSFEVATVKPASRNAGLFSAATDPAMVRYSHVTLRNFVEIAYNNRLISGPAWLDSEYYDLAARLPAGTAQDRVPSMLKTLLAERFKLAIHREVKEQRVYFLVVAKNGPRLKEVQPPDVEAA